MRSAVCPSFTNLFQFIPFTMNTFKLCSLPPFSKRRKSKLKANVETSS